MRVVLLTLLLIAASAEAAHSGQVWFLSNSELGPAADGAMAMDPPGEGDASVRLVTAAGVETAKFWLPADAEHEPHMQGPLFAGVWLEQTPGEEATFEAMLLMVDAAGEQVLANASFAIVPGPPPEPDPAALLPPDPTNPEAAAWHLAAQAYPFVAAPPYLVNFGIVDQQIPEDAALAVSFRLAPDSAAAAETLKYGVQTSPSFVFFPWHEPLPEPTKTSSPSAAPSVTSSPSEEAEPEAAPAEDSPSVAFALLVGVVALALLRRR